MADSGTMTFWQRGGPLAPRDNSFPADGRGTLAGAFGNESFWHWGSPQQPSNWNPTYGYGTYGSGSFGTYGNLTADKWWPTRITADYFERIVPVSTAIGKDSYNTYTWGGSGADSRMQVDGRRLKYIIDQNVSNINQFLPVQVADGRITMQWEFEQDISNDALHTNDSYIVAIIFRKTDSTHWYRFLFQMQAGGANQIAVQKTSNGGTSYSNIGSSLITNEIISPLPTSQLTRINMWVDYKDTRIRAACWRDGDAFPGVMFDFTDSAITGVGDVGINYDAASYSSGAKYTTGINYFIVDQPLATVPTDTATGVDASTVTTGAVSKSGTDSGTGTDASTLHAALPRTDTSTGSDASSENAAYPRTDSAAGTDASSQHAALPRTDAASGTDASTETAAVPRTDSASGSDASTEHGTYARSDTASGIDASTGRATYPRTDTAVGLDASTLHASLSRTESASANDASTEHAVFSVSDSGTATDAATVTKPVVTAVPAIIWQDGQIKVWLSGDDMDTAIYEPELDADPSAFFVAT